MAGVGGGVVEVMYTGVVLGNASEGVIHWCHTGKHFGGQLVVCSCFLHRVLMRGCCQVWLWLTEINSIILTCCMLSRSPVFMDVLCIPAEDSPIYHSLKLSSVGKLGKLATINALSR